jgi:hypothetical protein
MKYIIKLQMNQCTQISNSSRHGSILIKGHFFKSKDKFKG